MGTVKPSVVGRGIPDAPQNLVEDKTDMKTKRKKRIAVFDVDTNECAATADAVREHYGSEKVLVEEHSDMKTFVEVFSVRNDMMDGYDVVFLSVDGMLGVETGRNIREIDRLFDLFIVSNDWDYGYMAHRLHALDYLIKPVTAQNVSKAEERIRWKRTSDEHTARSIKQCLAKIEHEEAQ